MEPGVVDLVRRAEKEGRYELLVFCTPGLQRSCLSRAVAGASVDLVLEVDMEGDHFARRPHPSEHVEASIEARWVEQQKVLGDNLWNASKFRLNAIRVSCRHEQGVVHRKFHLEVGATDYRAHQGTTLAPNALKAFRSAERGAPWCHLANAIGNAAILETADGKIVCQRRSSRLGEASGRWVLPGGHPEPSNVATSIDVTQGVWQEFLDAVKSELCDELNLPTCRVSDPVFLGLVRRKVDWRPTYACWCTTSLTSTEVEYLWMQGGKDTGESTMLYFLKIPAHDDDLLFPTDSYAMFFEACGLRGQRAEHETDQRSPLFPNEMVEDHRGALCLYWIQRLFVAELLPMSHDVCEYFLRPIPK
ncbi:hypothetical protein, conserved [Cyanidioschyzon merolae strain 10D]|jgi:hypothetical protein|uniref:Nudix hydrolase domain-containing protein n=1 Tax=Cyanidioschyzon merolae (strain NIES-3377 / 10D) TaxID=280699 RepID=M1VCP4_CYAM1|nr:hypothetical protein, conserved [Cyanidioschyzon merolae strain 10D]BAM80377.1 hypothetical protein, conserved [Cyanidioschyzon merolae strain 10D]|eukprot:XP_005534984.1 hypothetical protein, conserved [Cyanidioschyzon merolae strain 10D]